MATSSRCGGGGSVAALRPPPPTSCSSRCSTAHANLRRILAVISSQASPLPSPAPPPFSVSHLHDLSGLGSAGVCHAQGGPRLDLSLSLGPVPLEITINKVEEEEEEEENKGRGRRSLSACSAVGGGEPEGAVSTAGAATDSTKAESIVVSKSAEKVSYAEDSEKSSEGECEVRDEAAAFSAEEEDEQQGKDCCSEITNVAVKAGAGGEEEVEVEEEEEVLVEANNKGNEVEKTRGGAQPQGTCSDKSKGEGYLDLLLEAVRQVTGGTFGEEEEEAKCVAPEAAVEVEAGERNGRPVRPKRGSCWSAMGLYGVEEDYSSPIVRSKRGRNQVLPSRYRDSVLEPWGKPATASGGYNNNHHHHHFHHRTARTGATTRRGGGVG